MGKAVKRTDEIIASSQPVYLLSKPPGLQIKLSKFSSDSSEFRCDFGVETVKFSMQSLGVSFDGENIAVGWKIRSIPCD